MSVGKKKPTTGQEKTWNAANWNSAGQNTHARRASSPNETAISSTTT